MLQQLKNTVRSSDFEGVVSSKTQYAMHRMNAGHDQPSESQAWLMRKMSEDLERDICTALTLFAESIS